MPTTNSSRSRFYPLYLGVVLFSLLTLLAPLGSALAAGYSRVSPQAALPTYTKGVGYDAGSSNALPDSTKMFYQEVGFGISRTFDSANKVALLDTTASLSNYAGYAITNTLYSALDRNLGYSFNFTVRVISETHGPNNDRAGFSAIVVGQDFNGIELGFWENTIFAQNADFTPGESVAFDTKTALVDYQIRVLDSSYTLLANGTPRLTGSLRDYRASAPVFPPLPYTVPNSNFLGDDTMSAKANLALSKASMEANIGLLVTSVTDIAASPPPTLPVTLRQAVSNASGTAGGAIITFDPALGASPTISLTAPLTVTANLQLQAPCANRVQIKTSPTSPLTLSGSNLLQGLNIYSTTGSGPALQIVGKGHQFICTRVSVLGGP